VYILILIIICIFQGASLKSGLGESSNAHNTSTNSSKMIDTTDTSSQPDYFNECNATHYPSDLKIHGVDGGKY